jgi:mono/diheme cytochrome c family protein
MTKKTIIFIFSAAILLVFSSLNWFTKIPQNILEYELSLGVDTPTHYLKTLDEKLVEIGYSLVHNGKATSSVGKKGKRISKYFVCTDCHNVKPEHSPSAIISPEEGLAYTAKNKLPFLPATTLYGAVNRKTWYNDDYVKKYGDLVKPARNNLSEAIQLCSKECSQGRYLENWELEAMLHYFHSIQFTFSDLELDYNKLVEKTKNEQLSIIQSKYPKYSPATFLAPKTKSQREYGKEGDINNGKLIYEGSCVYCHDKKRVSNQRLGKDNLSLSFLSNNLHTETAFNVYSIVRSGTNPLPGYKPYMPHYTAERLSDKQLEDLVAFIKRHKY